jgi:hypothetical protein
MRVSRMVEPGRCRSVFSQGPSSRRSGASRHFRCHDFPNGPATGKTFDQIGSRDFPLQDKERALDRLQVDMMTRLMRVIISEEGPRFW